MLESTYVSRRQAAAFLGLSPSFLAHRAGAPNSPPMRKIGRRVIYKLEELQTWADGHVVAPRRPRGRPRKSKR